VPKIAPVRICQHRDDTEKGHIRTLISSSNGRFTAAGTCSNSRLTARYLYCAPMTEGASQNKSVCLVKLTSLKLTDEKGHYSQAAFTLDPVPPHLTWLIAAICRNMSQYAAQPMSQWDIAHRARCQICIRCEKLLVSGNEWSK